MAAEEECRKKSERLVALDKEMKNFKKQIAVSLLCFILFLGRKLTFTCKIQDFFYLGFLSWTLAIHRTAGERRGRGRSHLFYLPPLPPTHAHSKFCI